MSQILLKGSFFKDSLFYEQLQVGFLLSSWTLEYLHAPLFDAGFILQPPSKTSSFCSAQIPSIGFCHPALVTCANYW